MASAHGHAVRSRANDGDEPVRVLPMRVGRRSEMAGEIARYLGAVSILVVGAVHAQQYYGCLLYTSPSPRDS